MPYRNEWMVQTIEELEKNEIRYEIADHRYYIFYCYRKSDGARYTYYAGSGRIMGVKQLGLNALIALCNDDRKELVFEDVKIKIPTADRKDYSRNRVIRFPYDALLSSESGRATYANAAARGFYG